MSPADDDPLPLADACALYPQSRLTVSTLRAEAARGRLKVFRIGRRDYTTRRDLQEMFTRCRDADSRRASITTRPAAIGSSVMAEHSSALASLTASLPKRKERSLTT
jgi:hypothetical protein